MRVRKFVEDCILELANIIEENRELRDEVSDLQHMNDEYEQFIGEMGMEDLFFDRNGSVGNYYYDYDGYGYPKGYGTTYGMNYPRVYGYNYQNRNVSRLLRPGEIDATALTLGIGKMLAEVRVDEKSAGVI